MFIFIFKLSPMVQLQNLTSECTLPLIYIQLDLKNKIHYLYLLEQITFLNSASTYYTTIFVVYKVDRLRGIFNFFGGWGVQIYALYNHNGLQFTCHTRDTGLELKDARSLEGKL